MQDEQIYYERRNSDDYIEVTVETHLLRPSIDWKITPSPIVVTHTVVKIHMYPYPLVWRNESAEFRYDDDDRLRPRLIREHIRLFDEVWERFAVAPDSEDMEKIEAARSVAAGYYNIPGAW